MNSVLILILSIPLLEIYLFIKIGSAVGAFNTIALILVAAIVGVAYARYEGFNTLKSGMSQLYKNQMPLFELMSGAALAVAAILLIFPGFATDLLGSLIIFISKFAFISILGFIIAGFGVASIVPICYTLISRIENLDQTVGVTIITLAVYGNFTIAPPILGYTANLLGIQYVYLPISILFIVCLGLAINSKKILKLNSF